MRKSLFSLVFSIACFASADAQTTPPQSPNRPAAKLAGTRIAAVPAKPAVKPKPRPDPKLRAKLKSAETELAKAEKRAEQALSALEHAKQEVESARRAVDEGEL